MPYTTTEQVRSHILRGALPATSMRDCAVTIDSNDPITFWGLPTTKGSLVAKARRSRAHTRLSAVLTNPFRFSQQPVVPGSVVIASDSSLGQVFVEPVDFIIDNSQGQLTVRSGGALVVGNPITIWYLPYTVLSESTDYRVDYEDSTLRRIGSGDIALGETVYLDFTSEYSSVTDDVVEAAVVAANGLIERLVDSESQYEADPVLGLAATYSALEIVCRSAAAHDLAYPAGQDASAKVWLQLANDYAARAESLISAFRPPKTPLAPPTLS